MGKAHTAWDGRYKDTITRSLPEQLLSIGINTRQRYERAPKPAFFVSQEIATPEGKQRIAWAVLKELGQGRRAWLYGFELVLRVPVVLRGIPTGETMLSHASLKWFEHELLPLQLATVPPAPEAVSPVGENQADRGDCFEIQHQRLMRLGEVGL